MLTSASMPYGAGADAAYSGDQVIPAMTGTGVAWRMDGPKPAVGIDQELRPCQLVRRLIGKNCIGLPCRRCCRDAISGRWLRPVRIVRSEFQGDNGKTK